MNKLKAWYASLQQREQRVVAVRRRRLRADHPDRRNSHAVAIGRVSGASRQAKPGARIWLGCASNAPEIRARGGDIPADTGEAPVVLVDRVGREAGLAGSLRGTQPNTTGGVRVQLEAAPFDTLVTWLDTLDRRYGLAIESITVDRTPAPGLVNASISFSQPRH